MKEVIMTFNCGCIKRLDSEGMIITSYCSKHKQLNIAKPNSITDNAK